MIREEEAIAVLENEIKCVDKDCNIERSCGSCPYAMPSKEPIFEAYKMAIKALEQKPCADAIGRQAVLEIIRDFEYKNSHEEMLINLRIKQLPSITPAEKVGRWITLKDEYGDVCEAVCSNCDSNGNHKWVYCPNCGAKMQEEEVEE